MSQEKKPQFTNKEVYAIYDALFAISDEQYPFDFALVISRNYKLLKTWFGKYCDARKAVTDTVKAKSNDMGLIFEDVYKTLSEDIKEKVTTEFEKIDKELAALDFDWKQINIKEVKALGISIKPHLLSNLLDVIVVDEQPATAN